MTSAFSTFDDQPPDRLKPFAAPLLYLAAALVFGVLAYTSIELTRGGGRVAAVWIPNAIAVALLMRVRVRHEGLFIGCIWLANALANLIGGDPLGSAFALAACNALEIQLAVFLARRWAGHRPDMLEIGQLWRFLAATAVAAPMVSAVFAALALGTAGANTLAVWGTWAITDGLGMALVAPAILIVWDAWPKRKRPNRRQLTDWGILTLIGTAATIAVFAQTEFPLLFIAAPIVLAHTFRLGVLGTTFSVTKIAVIATIFTTEGMGPINLINHSASAEIIVLQIFLAACFLVGLPVAAMLKGRERMIAEIDAGRRELALLTENITDAILRYDMSGKCTYASPSVAEVLGAPPSEFLGRKASHRGHPDSRAQINQVEQRLLHGDSEKERLTYRRLIDGENGEPVFIEADCAIARDPLTNDPSGIIVSARDITERVTLELQLTRARRHAENAARAKSEFLANMSHEIRTPMNGVLGFAELLLQSEGLAPTQKKHAQLIVQSGRSMMLLLNDILDLSKIEAGQIVLDHQPVELDALVEECADLHRASAKKKGLEIIVQGERNPPCVVTDGLRLRQIVLNLVGNAVKFTERGGVSISYSTAQDQFSIAVEDTGIGISSERLTRIFRPFEQGENDTARRFGGTGLGLSISRQLAELLGGFLEAKSTSGEGSRFIVTLPLVRAAHKPKQDQSHIPERSVELPPASSILLAEDHDVNRLLVTAMLERCGQKVSLARDGDEAISAVLEAFACGKPYDLVLMDIQMPGCDGYAAARSIRAEGISAGKLPIIALTANAFPEDIAAARDAGMQGHMAKPLAFAELVETLQRWLPTRIIDDAPRAAIDPAARPQAIDEKPAPSPVEQSVIRSPELQQRWQERRREAVDAVSVALREGRLCGREGEELARLVHKLAGTAGMFGEEILGERAAEFERALRSEEAPEVRRKLAAELLDLASGVSDTVQPNA